MQSLSCERLFNVAKLELYCCTRNYTTELTPQLLHHRTAQRQYTVCYSLQHALVPLSSTTLACGLHEDL
jgi:hypothetical protein